MYHQLLAQQRHHRLDLRQPHGQRQGRRVGVARLQAASASASCATSRTAWPGCKQQPWVDASRIGINGWSYGGFMVSYALTHSRASPWASPAAPVTDWRNYDTIYTERYMRTPQNNPEGYRDSAAVRGGRRTCTASCCSIHGAIDDNVHPQNTMQFAYELQKAGKPFQHDAVPEVAPRRHRPGAQSSTCARLMLDFVEETPCRRASRTRPSPCADVGQRVAAARRRCRPPCPASSVPTVCARPRSVGGHGGGRAQRRGRGHAVVHQQRELLRRSGRAG